MGLIHVMGELTSGRVIFGPDNAEPLLGVTALESVRHLGGPDHSNAETDFGHPFEIGVLLRRDRLIAWARIGCKFLGSCSQVELSYRREALKHPKLARKTNEVMLLIPFC